jgi:uncharacterized surface protein with fasciclin (FAS1) repeats
MRLAATLLSSLSLCCSVMAQPMNMTFDDGIGGWRVVLDGVMGGRSSGRVSQPESGILRFSGQLSLENNGGFSQIQTSIAPGSLQDGAGGGGGVEIRVRGDGRTYIFDLRTSDVRIMAGSFQTTFDTVAGEWTTVRLPFEQFRLHSFGRLVSNAPRLNPERIESIGVTLADKNAGPFRIDFDSIRSLETPRAATAARPGRAAQPTAASGADLATVARSAGLTTLLSLVEIAGIELPPDGRVTIFAPTNEAFAALPAERVRFLTSEEGRPLLRAVLAHHVVPEAVDSAALLQRRTATSLSNQDLTIDGEALKVAGALLLKTDVLFERGIVHVIDSVMIPETRSAAEVVGAEPRLSSLFRAVNAAGLARQLGSENEGPWTILAPSNEAFAALGEREIAALVSNPMQLVNILGGHVIPGRIRRSDMIAQGSVRTLMGRDAVTFAIAEGQVTAGGARIIAADIPASNGIIHIIDRIILPAPAAPATAGAPAGAAPSAAAILQLAELTIERGVPLFNDGQPEACAVVYELFLNSVVKLAQETLGPAGTGRIQDALAQGATERDPAARAWIYRRAIDRMYQDLSRVGPPHTR